MSDPATLIDCAYCDGTYWPHDTHCSFCKNPTNEVDVFWCKTCNDEMICTFTEFEKHEQGHEITCSLCGMRFKKNDTLIEQRKKAHEIFHTACKAQKRNTTEGIVIWKSEVSN